MERVINVIIKDNNRTVNWEFPPETELADVMKRWEKGYFPVKNIVICGTEIEQILPDWHLSSFTEDGRLRIIVRTDYPKKRKDGEG